MSDIVGEASTLTQVGLSTRGTGGHKKYQKVFIEEVITRTTALRVNDRETHQCDTGRQVGLPGNLDPTCVELCMCVG